MLKLRKKTANKLIVASILLVLIIILSSLKTIPYVAEYIYARGISRAIITVSATLTSWFPLAVFEILAIIGIVCVIISLIHIVKYIKYKRYYKIYEVISKLLIASLSVILMYTMTASFSYYRQPVENYLPQAEYEMTEDELLTMAKSFLKDLNELSAKFERDSDGNIIPKYSYNELAKRMQKEFEKLDSDYFNPVNVKPKRLISSRFFAFFGIVGVSFQPTGEASVSYLLPKIDLPYYMAHEMSHTKGCMYESDAELLAAYITLTSTDDYIRYSGYSAFFNQIMTILFYNRINDEIINEEILFSRSREFLIEKMNAFKYYNDNYGAFRKIGNAINDFYLKMSGAKGGTASYDDYSGTIETPVYDDNGEVERIEVTIHYSNIQKLLLAIYKDKQ